MPVSGHEPRFRRLFQQEAGPGLDRLAHGLLALETSPVDPELVNSLFRDAHNLKGASAVVGLDEVHRLAHAMEDMLAPLRRGQATATPETVDRLLAAVDAIRELLPAVVEGVGHSVDVSAVEALLRQGPESSTAGPTDAIQARPPASQQPASPQPANQQPATRQPASQEEPPTQGSAPIQDRAARDAKPATEVKPATGVEPATNGMAAANAKRAAQVKRAPDAGDAEVVEATQAQATTMHIPVARLDEIVRLVSEGGGAQMRLGRYIDQELGTDPGDIEAFRELSILLNDLQERTTRARMVPVSALADTLQRVVRDLARSLGKQARWEATGVDTELDRGIMEQLAGPLLHIVRNAVDHGIENPRERAAAGKPERGEIRLHAVQLGSEVVITLTDDGHGIDLKRVREEAGVSPADGTIADDEAMYLVFRTGLSTAAQVTEVSGRGVGLDIVRTNLDAVRGRIDIRSRAGEFTEFRISVPITLTMLPCLLVSSGGQRYALPTHTILTVLPPRPAELFCDGQPAVWVGDHTVPVNGLAETLSPGEEPEHGPAVVLKGITRTRAFRITELLGQRDVVIKGLSRLLPRLPVYIGASAEPDGTVLLVLDSTGLIDQARRANPRTEVPAAASSSQPPGTILVVDDALTVRELQRSILERAGYRVLTASDGQEALEVAEESPVDLVLTDVEMPRMNGFELTTALRSHPRLGGIGIVVLTSLGNDEDRARGLAAGADGYIIKNEFDEKALIGIVQRILGEST